MIILPPLPYEQNSLEPYISNNTISFHYDKHHKAYLNNVNNLIKNTELENLTLMEIIFSINGKDMKNLQLDIFRNAMQVWNHTFYWYSMKPAVQKKDNISELLLKKIENDFGSMERLKNELTTMAVKVFGSGWAWLVFNRESDKLELLSGSNEYNPALDKKYVPILTVDVWEHAYYLDYQNLRLNYVKNIVENILNWEFASDNFSISEEL